MNNSISFNYFFFYKDNQLKYYIDIAIFQRFQETNHICKNNNNNNNNNIESEFIFI
jgi:hypothetical protein